MRGAAVPGVARRGVEGRGPARRGARAAGVRIEVREAPAPGCVGCSVVIDPSGSASGFPET
jgi:hypothetical protein